MTAQQYLLSQAEHCHRIAVDTNDPFVAEELKRLAAEFKWRAQAVGGFEPGSLSADAPAQRFL